jgi:hypothetical protein
VAVVVDVNVDVIGFYLVAALLRQGITEKGEKS